MNSEDVLNFSLSGAALLAAAAFAYGIYHLVVTLHTVKLVLEDIKDATQDIQSLKNTLKFGLSSLAGKFISGKRG